MTNAAVRVATRFTRSVHLQRDFSAGGLAGYQITPLALQTLQRIVAGLRPGSAERAFSVVGPYGAGKSAFGVFLASFMRYDPSARAAMLADHGTPTADSILTAGPALLPVLISGNNSALRPAIIGALFEALSCQAEIRRQFPALLEALQRASTNPTIDPQGVAALVEQSAQAIAKSCTRAGLLLVIDELGQFLNHTAHYGDERDLFVLQALAESAARSAEHPLAVVTILHQSFERYTSGAGPTRQVEWAKVQGRFAELPFEEPASQMLRMVARALWPDDQPLPVWRRDYGARMSDCADVLGLRPADITPAEWRNLIARAHPLHPTVLAALPLLLRQLAQNERSLFAFLTAPEPGGVQDFAAQAEQQGVYHPLYRLPHLYEYVEANLGAGLFSRARGQRWAELAEARSRLGNVAGLAHTTLTAVGTLGALGQSRGLRASRALLTFALADELDDPQVGVALGLLEERRLITYRHHRESYQIWEGSDLDLDVLVAQTRREIDNQAVLVDLLAHHAPPAPLVARRFSYETGAPRLFAARFIDAADLPRSFTPPSGAEGELLYVVATNSEALQAAECWATNTARNDEPLRLVVLPERTEYLRELALEVAVLDYVLTHEGTLEHDRAARREVSARLVEAKQALTDLIASAYGTRHARWFWHAEQHLVADARAVDALLSAACAAAYPHTPRVWNELIVRRQLSSAATRARRILIEAMLDRGHEQRLGLSGFPPERAMYESLFAVGGLHRAESDGSWRFDAPPDEDPLHLMPVWQAIEAFFDSTLVEPRPLLDLHQLLEAPPYGVKPGLIPLLFVAAYLANSGEIALYEHRSYAPMPDMPLFERMLRQPGYFSIRRSRVSGVRVAVFERLARAMAPKALYRSGQPALLDAVTPLLRFVHQLPPYARVTRQVAAHTQAIRAALLDARAPDELLFESLPRACGLEPFDAATSADEAAVELFFGRLRVGLEELRAVFGTLRERVTARIAETFHAAAATPPALRDELLARYTRIVTADTQVRAFGVRVEHGDPAGAWVESVAALVGRKPLDAWNDADAAVFDQQIADLGRRFRLAEQLAFAATQLPPETPLFRVAVADGRGERSIVVNQEQLAADALSFQDELAHVADKYRDLSQHQRAAVIAALLQTLLSDD